MCVLVRDDIEYAKQYKYKSIQLIYEYIIILPDARMILPAL